MDNPGVDAGEFDLVSITDISEGMDAKPIAQVFDSFFTTEVAGKRAGLGLSQAQGFVKQSGGHVKIYSEPGQGTTMRLYLPRQHEPGAVTGTDLPDIDVAAVQAKSGDVILVEDDEWVRFLLVEALRDLGSTIVQAGDGTQALAILGQERRIYLLFTDIVMPGMSGGQLAAKAHEARPDLKVFYITGFTRDAVLHKGALDANEAPISKPFTIDQLTIEVRLLLDGGGFDPPDAAVTALSKRTLFGGPTVGPSAKAHSDGSVFGTLLYPWRLPRLPRLSRRIVRISCQRRRRLQVGDSLPR